MTRAAAVYLRHGRYLITASSETEAGFWYDTGLVETLPETAEAADLGAAVLRCLSGSKRGVPTPDFRSGGGSPHPILVAAGVGTDGAFMKGARHVGVEERDDAVMIMPSENRGTEGFVGLPDRVVRTGGTGAGELGAAVRAAIRDAS